MGADIATWVGLAFTILVACLGGLAYIQSQIKQQDRETNEKVDAKAAEVTARLEKEIARVESDLHEERSARRADVARVERQLEVFGDVASAVKVMSANIVHLTEKITDGQRHTETAVDDLKHSMRAMELRMAAMPGAATAARRIRKKEGEG